MREIGRSTARVPVSWDLSGGTLPSGDSEETPRLAGWCTGRLRVCSIADELQLVRLLRTDYTSSATLFTFWGLPILACWIEMTGGRAPAAVNSARHYVMGASRLFLEYH